MVNGTMNNDSKVTSMKRPSLSWGWRIAIVYTTFAVATLGFVAYAMTQNVDLVRQDYYEFSLRHDHTMAARQRAAALPQQPVSYDEDQNTLFISIPTAPQHHAELRLYRPSSSLLDTTYVLTTDVDGSAQVGCSHLVSGHWTATLRWTTGGNDYEYELPLHLAQR